MASTFGLRVPWVRGLPRGIHDWTADKDTWELYHLGEDWSQASDLAAEMPGKFAELKELVLIEATKAARSHRRRALDSDVHPELRPAPPYAEWTFFGDTVRVPEFSAPALGTRPNVVAIEAVIPEHANGVPDKLAGSRGRHVLRRGRHPVL